MTRRYAKKSYHNTLKIRKCWRCKQYLKLKEFQTSKFICKDCKKGKIRNIIFVNKPITISWE